MSAKVSWNTQSRFQELRSPHRLIIEPGMSPRGGGGASVLDANYPPN